MATFGWCLDGHCRTCPGQRGRLVCDCPHHQRAAREKPVELDATLTLPLGNGGPGGTG
jgi:hypothetical protein